jgi:4-hydroxybenzoate polyprenyltransferase
MKKISAFLRIMRPAGIVVAIADVLAGVTIAGRFENGLDKTWVNVYLRRRRSL